MATREEILARFASNIIDALNIETFSTEHRDELIGRLKPLLEGPVMIYSTAIAWKAAEKKVRHSVQPVGPSEMTFEQQADNLRRQVDSLISRAFRDYDDRLKQQSFERKKKR